MRGIPDMSQEMMERWVGDTLQFMGEKSAAMNKHLPAGMQLPTDWGQAKSAIARLTQLTYAAGIGGRPATFIRDLFQSLNAAYILGPVKFARGLSKALTKEGWAQAKEYGFTLEKNNVGELYGDILGELSPYGRADRLSQAIDKLLAPSRIGHNIG